MKAYYVPYILEDIIPVTPKCISTTKRHSGSFIVHKNDEDSEIFLNLISKKTILVGVCPTKPIQFIFITIIEAI